MIIQESGFADLEDELESDDRQQAVHGSSEQSYGAASCGFRGRCGCAKTCVQSADRIPTVEAGSSACC